MSERRGLKIGTHVQHSVFEGISGVIEKDCDFHYRVRVDPECDHFREDVLIAYDEILTDADVRRRERDYALNGVKIAADRLANHREHGRKLRADLNVAKEFARQSGATDKQIESAA